MPALTKEQLLELVKTKFGEPDEVLTNGPDAWLLQFEGAGEVLFYLYDEEEDRHLFTHSYRCENNSSDSDPKVAFEGLDL